MTSNNNIQEIEQIFKVPDRVADKIRNVVEKVKGGYVLIETRPRWDGSPGPWTKCLMGTADDKSRQKQVFFQQKTLSK